MAEVVISPLAKEDMAQIAEYIRLELSNGNAALRLMQRFRKAIVQLRDFPDMGKLLSESRPQMPPYRMLVCGNYLIFYHVGDDTVMVDRVFYGRRDYLPLLFGDQITEE